MRIGARDGDFARLQRLAQRIEHRALEFGQFIKEQHAEMREAHLARPHFQPAAGQRRHRSGVVRAAERARAADPAFLQQPRDRGDERGFERLCRGQFGQNAGQARGHQRFARTRRADHQQVVPACRGDFQRALGGFLTFDLLEIGAAFGPGDFAGHRLGQPLGAFQMVEQADEIGRGDNLDPARPAGLCALPSRADQRFFDTAGMERGEQYAGAGDHAPVECEFSHRDILRNRFQIDHAHRREQRQRNRQIVVRAFLGQVCG